ncbi:MAG: GDSL-type esterase/lipase family protein [Ruthenibacterium sp.]
MAWEIAWAYLSIDYGEVIGTMSDVTQRMVIKNNLNGNKIRVKFTNKYGVKPLLFKRVTAQIENMPPVAITLNESQQVEIPVGKDIYSDECILHVKAGQEITICLYAELEVEVRSICVTWAAKSWHCDIARGDTTNLENCTTFNSPELYDFLEQDVHKSTAVCGICEVQILAEEPVNTVALFGDSITHMSYYCDLLEEKLYAQYPGKVTVVNAGIGGNRLCWDATYVRGIPGNGRLFGEAGRTRFENDIFGSVKPNVVISLIGINDLVHGVAFNIANQIVSSKDLINEMQEIIEVAHRHKTKIYLCTIMPFLYDNIEWPTQKIERQRKLCNEWICSQQESDGVFDFAAAVNDADNPNHMLENCHLGDGIHPNFEGGAKMVDAIDLKKLMEGK